MNSISGFARASLQRSFRRLAMASLLAAAIIAPSTSFELAPVHAQASQTIIDTFPDWDGNITSGWRGTAQTITAPANNVLTAYRFQLAPRSGSNGQVRVSVYQWVQNGPSGDALYTTLIDWTTAGGVVDMAGLNVTLTPGTLYGIAIDLLGYSGQSVHFNGNRNSYTGGNGWWSQDPVSGSWTNFSSLNHKFRAVFGIGGDSDSDGIADTTDNCPSTPNANQANLDGDGQGDACDTDDDNDTILDLGDNCPLTANSTQANNDGDAFGDACDPDDDNDTVFDSGDNCPLNANLNQTDSDGDAVGDACDSDDDNDNVLDSGDNCPLNANSNQEDNDGDAFGDVCDPDDDNDTVFDLGDNCPLNANLSQTDSDGDTIGDACDADDDGDEVLDGADNCQLVSNADQTNTDGDLFGDACDADDDNDTVLDDADNCQFVSNLDQANNGDDTLGNACDADDDNDEVLDGADNCQFTSNADQTDADGDGRGDSCDNCAAFSNPGQEDADADGVGDACELTGIGPEGEPEQKFPPGQNVEHEYQATVPGQTEPETLVVSLGVVTNTTICSVNFRLVLLAETALQLEKLNQIRDAEGKPRLRQIEYTDANHNERGYGIRYEIECQVDEDDDGIGDRQAIPGQDYDRPTIAFTFHAEIDGQFGIVQEQTLHQVSPDLNQGDGLPDGWDFETDVPAFAVDQYDVELEAHLAKSSCDCVGSASPEGGFSWFIAVTADLEQFDPDGPGPAQAAAAELVVLSPPVRPDRNDATKSEFYNPFRRDGTFRAGDAVPITVRLRYTDPDTGATAFISDTESDLIATVKRVIDDDVDVNVALEGFLDVWGDDGNFIIDPWLKGYYTYVWKTVEQDTRHALPPGKYSVTIASKYTTAKPFFIYLR